MPIITLELRSDRNRRVRDTPDAVEKIRGPFVHPLDIDRGLGLVVMNLVPGIFRFRIEVAGFRKGEFDVVARAHQDRRVRLKLTHHASRLPSFGELVPEQRRLFESLHPQDPGLEWRELPENQACTFFQVSYALAHTTSGETPLSRYFGPIRVIGGAQIRDRATDGSVQGAVGWRMHAAVRPWYRKKIAQALGEFGFQKDGGPTHPTHAKFGFVDSFRQKGKDPRLQVVLKPSPSVQGSYVGADLDLDVTAFHRSSPSDVYDRLVRKFPAVKDVYVVG